MPYKDPARQKQAQQEWYQRNKPAVRTRTRESRNKARKFLTEYKLEHPTCLDCGNDYPPHILDFDHVKDKVEGLSVMARMGAAIDSLMIEIEKCEVVCANCHRERTHQRKIARYGSVV